MSAWGNFSGNESRNFDEKNEKEQKRMKQVEKHCRTLSVIKHYCKKLYTEPI